MLLILVFVLCSCGNRNSGKTGNHEKDADDKSSSYESELPENTDKAITDNFQISELIGIASDYSNKDNWIKIPELTKPADTIYLYPTSNMDASESAQPICSIDDQAMRARAQATYEVQATVFEEATNVFAPYYRQSNINHVITMTNEELEAFQMKEQRTDVYAALDYYFEHYNQGRPFILAGHSQGSLMVKIVLGEYMQAHPEYLERMVAAYPIGYSITEDWLEQHPYLKFAKEAGDTGVIVSWNTEGPGNKGQKNLVVEDHAISINPINWKRDETPAAAAENLGSRMLDRESGTCELRMGVADAVLDTERGVVICHAAEPFMEDGIGFGPESYHNNDYQFYYENLKQNAALRVQNYFNKTR